MRAERGSVRDQILGLVLAQKSVSNAEVQALLGTDAKHVASRLAQMERHDWLERLPGTGSGRMRWQLSTQGAARVPTGATDLLSLQVQREQLTQKIKRIRQAQDRAKAQRAEERRAALASAAAAGREAAAQARQAARERTAQERQAAALRGHSAAQRPMALPGSRLVAPPEPAGLTGTVLADPARHFRHAPVQDPQGLLNRPAEPPVPPAPPCPGGGLLRPHGPYIRAGGQAHLAAPSRRGEALVAHRPPLSQP